MYSALGASPYFFSEIKKRNQKPILVLDKETYLTYLDE